MDVTSAPGSAPAPGSVPDAPPAAGARAARLLAEHLPGAVVRRVVGFGEETVYLQRDGLVAALTLLRDHPQGQYTTALFCTAVDYPEREVDLGEPRFDVVYQLRSQFYNDVCRVIVQAPEEDPTVPTVENVFAGMDWHEREMFDLCGVSATGHHDLRRILMPEDWEGHPLRKDYISFAEPIAFSHNVEWALPAQERPPHMQGSQR